jgi:hypothetical protein
VSITHNRYNECQHVVWGNGSSFNLLFDCNDGSTGSGRCLLDTPPQDLITKEQERSQSLPGESFTEDRQCQLVFGETSKICSYMVSLLMTWCLPVLPLVRPSVVWTFCGDSVNLLQSSRIVFAYTWKIIIIIDGLDMGLTMSLCTIVHLQTHGGGQDTHKTVALVMKTRNIDVFKGRLWSSGQSNCLLTQRPWVRFPALPHFLCNSGSGTGSTQPREDNWRSMWIRK